MPHLAEKTDGVPLYVDEMTKASLESGVLQETLDEMTLQREVGRLVEAELVYQRGLPPHATYMFKHALIQEAAYQSLLKRTRQEYHQRMAQVLATQFPNVRAFGTLSPATTICFPSPNWRGNCGTQYVARMPEGRRKQEPTSYLEQVVQQPLTILPYDCEAAI
jgi:predicted ATPase